MAALFGGGDQSLQIIIKARDEASGVIKGIGRSVGGLKGKIEGMRPIFKKMAAVGGAAFGVLAMGAKSAVKAAAELEQQQIAFATMLGSEEKALAMLKELSDFAVRTPFEIQGIRQNAKQLLAMGIETDKLLPTLKTLGDVAAGVSVPLWRVALNFGQVKTQAKLTGRELRDFAVLGIPILGELAKTLGTTKEAVREMVSAGEIGFEEVEQAFINMSSEGGKFFNLMEKQALSAAGMWSNFKDEVTLTKEVIGTELLPIIKELVGGQMTPLVKKLREFVEENPKLSAGILIVSLALTGLVMGLGLIGLALPAVIGGVTALSGMFAILLGPIGLVIIAIGVVVATLIWFWNNTDRVQKLIRDSWDTLKNNIKFALEIMQTNFEKWWNSIRDKVLDPFLSFLERIWDMVQKIASSPFDLGKSVGQKLSSFLPSFQVGGIVPGRTGEAVPIMAHAGERVIPSGQARRMSGAGNTINVVINNPVVKSEDDVAVLKEQLERTMRDVVRGHKLVTI